MSGRGGPRPGAGRPARREGEETIPLPGVRLNQAEYLALRKIVDACGPEATVSDGVRAAILGYAATLPAED